MDAFTVRGILLVLLLKHLQSVSRHDISHSTSAAQSVPITLESNVAELCTILHRYGERGGDGNPPVEILDEWVKRPPPGYQPPSDCRSALDPLPESYPVPCSRFVLRDLNLSVALCEEEPGTAAHLSIPSHGAEAKSQIHLSWNLDVQAQTFLNTQMSVYHKTDGN